MSTAAMLRTLVDTLAIRDLLAKHSRGIDRCDAALLDQVWDAEGHVAYGFFTGAPRDFSATVTGLMRGGPITLHRTSNMWVKVEGDHAVSESYVLAYRVSRDEGVPPVQTLIGGRYLDRFQRKDGNFRMTHRQYVMEWNINRGGTGSALPGFAPAFGDMGAHGDSDPSTGLFSSDGPTAPGTGERQMAGTVDLMQDVEVALSRLAISDLIMAQARATDRRDAELLASVWHDGATVDVGFYNGPAEGYTDVLFKISATLKRMYHSVANQIIEVRGASAVAESYVIAFGTAPGGTGDNDQLMGGRYLDRFERRDGVWKYTSRRFVLDWSIDQPSSDRSDAGMLAMLSFGGRFPDDPVYALWNSLPA
jgi:hypothetical protein